MTKFKVFKSTSNFKVKVTRSKMLNTPWYFLDFAWYPLKSFVIRNLHVLNPLLGAFLYRVVRFCVSSTVSNNFPLKHSKGIH